MLSKIKNIFEFDFFLVPILKLINQKVITCTIREDVFLSVGFLLYSHSPNDVPPEPQRNVSIAAVRGAVRPSNRASVGFL